MYSTKNFTLARLCLVFLIILNHASGFPGSSDPNKIFVTDFKYFRRIYFNKQQLLVYKNPSIKSIYYLSDKYELETTKFQKTTTSNFKLDSNKTNYKISFSNGKMKFLSKKKTIYFDTSDYSICEKNLSEKALNIDLRPYTKGIKASIISGLTDSTCSEDQKETIGISLQNMLDSEKSWLSKCYANDSVNKLIKTDPNYLSYSLSVYSKYLDLVKKLGEGGKPIQISCDMNTAERLGSFNETTSPAKISLDWSNLKKLSRGEQKLPENIKATLGHELFHYGEQMQTPTDNVYDKCINESYAKLFTDVCLVSENEKNLKNIGDSDASKIKDQKIPTSNQLAAACKNQTKVAAIISKDLTIKEQETGEASGAHPIFAGELQNQQQLNTSVQNKLGSGANPVTQSDFTQPSDSDFATLASNTTAGTTEGSSYTIPANSSFGQVVQKTMNSFANSGNTLTNKLNAAVATTTNTANATTTTLASNNTGTTTTGSTYVPTSSSSSKIQKNNSPNTATRMPTSVDESYSGTTGKTSLGSSGQPSEMGGGNPEKNNSFYTGSGNLGNTNAGKGGSPQTANSGVSSGGGSGGTVSSGGGSTTGGSAPTQKTAQQKQAEGSEMVKTIQSLKAFNTVSGGQYQEVKKYYANPQFLNLLQTYDMRIMVKNPTGQYMAIGVDSKKAKKVFNDDGQILKTVEEKK